MEIKKKIMLGLLTNRGFKAQTLMSLLHMVNQTRDVEWIPVLSPNCFSIAENRNWLAARALKLECDKLLMIDDDMVFPPETLRVMLSSGKDIVAVPLHTKVLPRTVTVEPVEGSLASETRPGEVSRAGTGIMLIDTKVFQDVPQPWFSFEQNEFGMTLEGEDWVFCKKARAQGFTIWNEPLEVGHVGEFTY
jgi:hypothetical protein